MMRPRRSLPPSLFALALAAFLSSCTGDVDRRVTPPGTDAAKWNPLHMTPVMFPPNESQVVLGLDESTNETLLAIELGLEVVHVSAADGTKVVLFDDPGDPVDPEDLDEHPDVDEWSTNYETTIMASGQTLILGFYEGDWERTSGDEQDAFASLDLEAVHERTTGTGVTIAFLDTGADLWHPVLRSNARPLPDEYEMSQWESDTRGPAYGHGTAVAGAAVMVAPGIEVLSIRVLDETGTGSVYQLYRGVMAAVQENVDIINLSLSLSDDDPLFERHLGYVEGRGITVVSAAGNHGLRNPKYPATSARTVGVAAVRNNDRVANFSGVGENITLAAPGVTVYSSYPSRGYALLTGTSIATPMVSGAIALMHAYTGSPADCIERLVETRASVYVGGQVFPGLGRIVPFSALDYEP